MTTRHTAAALAAVTLVAGCSAASPGPAPSTVTPSATTATGSPGTPRPSTGPATTRMSGSASTHVEPSTARPTPAPSTAGDLDQSVFAPVVGRWRAVAGSGDEGTYQPNGTWVHALPPEQVVASLSMQACAQPPTLPAPRAVLASDYEDPAGRRAVGQVLRFRSPSEATAFLDGYRALVATCVGRDDPMAVSGLSTSGPVVDRRVMQADRTRWFEAVWASGTLVRMFVANEQDQPLTPAEAAEVTRRA